MTGRVLVLGNAGLDLRIELPRLPRPGETLLGANPSRAPGGKGLNQAVCAARAGATVHLLAPLGADAQGDEIAAFLAAEPLTATLPRLPHPTDYSVLMVLPSGENSITGAGPCAAALSADAAAAFAATAGTDDILLIQGNLTEAATRAALHAAPRSIFNPSPLWWDGRSAIADCTIIVTNQTEATELTGLTGEAACLALRKAGPIAIVTLGAAGCLIADAAGLRHHQATPTRAIDTTGCGDTFCGMLAARLVQGHTVDAAIVAAQRAAALTATRPGAFAALPSAAELLTLAAG